MILLFHSLYLLCVQFLKDQRNKKLQQDIVEAKKCIEEEVNRHTTTFLDAELNLRFDPPVYKQRYEAVLKTLLDNRWRKHIRKVVDFGCAEFGLFYLLRTLYGLKEVLEVDIDESLLREYTFRLQPRTVDYIDKRPQPLTVKVYVGSVGDPASALCDIDVVIAVELIEHLYPDILDAFPYNVFCYIHPKLVIVTTPNADFNVLFKDFGKMRHYDHKFEWSREQFEDWGRNITLRFPDYMVSFLGIGSPPEDDADKGHCSQMALFVRQDLEDDAGADHKHSCRNVRSLFTTDSDGTETINGTSACGDCIKEHNFGICTYYSYSRQTIAYEREGVDDIEYKLIETVEYPYEERDPEEVVMHDIMYKVSSLGRVNGRYYSYDRDRAEVPLRQLTEWHMDGPFISESELRTILEKFGYTVEECVTDDGEDPILCVIYEPVMENSTTPTTESEVSECQQNDDFEADENHFSDWDAPINNEDVNIELEEAVISQASELIGGVLNDLETNEISLNYSQSEDSQNRPVATKLKFVMTKVMDAETSQNDVLPPTNKITKKHKDLKTENVVSSTATKLVTVCPPNSKEATPGTSTGKKRKTKSKKSDEDEVTEDVRELTECIVRNSLNRVEELPAAVFELQEIPAELNAQAAVLEEAIVELDAQLVEEALVVENGDLANNNRDIEGNNYAAEVQIIAAEDGNNENVVLENNEAADIRNEDFQNRNEGPENAVQEAVPPAEEEDDDDDDDIELTFASREALFDPNSKEDLLEDFEIPPAPALEASEVVVDQQPAEDEERPFNIVLLGVNMNSSDAPIAEPFPLWLLHLLGADVIDEDHTEPHFYCQGDGLGVHPSVVEVDIETSSSESSSNHSNDDAESEHTALESEIVSLSEDTENPVATQDVQTAKPSAESQTSKKDDESQDEFFDTKEEEQPSTSKGT